MLHRRRPRHQQLGATLRDGARLLQAGPLDAACVPLAFQAFAQRDGNRAGHGLAGQPGEFASQSAGFIILDVEKYQ